MVVVVAELCEFTKYQFIVKTNREKKEELEKNIFKSLYNFWVYISVSDYYGNHGYY